jgi:dimethylargininase
MRASSLIAITRPVSQSLAQCELTHLAREPIDVERARAQHVEYECLLASLGALVVRVPAAPDLPDAVFVEDIAVVLDEIAVVARPGAPSRRAESAEVASVLEAYRPVHAIEPPATLEGGDVLRLGRTLYVGRSRRTNDAGIGQLRSLAAPFGYRVVPIEVGDCLHLKSAVTVVADDLLLVNPAWIAAAALRGHETLCVDDREPYAANALRVADTIVFPAQFPRTRDRLIERGLCVAEVDCRELAKAEGAVTCCSLVFATCVGPGESGGPGASIGPAS